MKDCYTRAAEPTFITGNGNDDDADDIIHTQAAKLASNPSDMN